MKGALPDDSCEQSVPDGERPREAVRPGREAVRAPRQADGGERGRRIHLAAQLLAAGMLRAGRRRPPRGGARAAAIEAEAADGRPGDAPKSAEEGQT
jgi:hypothetical protein